MPWSSKVGMGLLALSRPVVLLVVTTAYVAFVPMGTAMTALFVTSAGAFVASSAVLVGWIPAAPRLQATILWLELGLVSVLNGTSALHRPVGLTEALYAPLAATLFLTLPPRQWRLFLLALAGSWVITSLPDWAVGGPAYPALYGSLALFAGSTGLLIRNLTDEKERSEALLQEVHASRAALEQAHRRLQETAARQQEMAVLEERQRLAREIHDGVAHALTALVVQVQAGRRLMDRAPDQAAATIARCEDLAREALQETRRAVRALHPAGLEARTEAEALARLGQDFAAATGMQVQVAADAGARGLAPDPVRLEQLYRIFQEALTNAHRHGQAGQVRADLALAGEMLNLTIWNDGAPPRSLEPGMGLKSMLERARSLGGTVTFAPGHRGLTVQVSVPVRGEAVS